jgi:hypothetical protein
MEGVTGRKEAGSAHYLFQKCTPLRLGSFFVERPRRDQLAAKKAHVRLLMRCFTMEMAKENLGATWEYKYRIEIAAQKLPHYDSAECMIADRFQDFTLETLIENNLPLAAIEYWMRLRRKHSSLDC